jgi:putative membrane protein
MVTHRDTSASNRAMRALLAACLRLFPPLRVGIKLWTAVAALAAYSLLVNFMVNLEHLAHVEWGAESTVLNGLVLSFLINFRNSHAYDRWWEARKLWGQLINETRDLALKVRSLNALTAAERDELGHLLIEFALALKNHLRRQDGTDEPPRGRDQEAPGGHEPSRIAGSLYWILARGQREQRIDGWTLLWLDTHVKSFMEICGACERIRNTPLSSSYRALLRHGIAIYLAISPFYLIEDTGLAGIPMFILAAYFLLGIELVAEEIEEPFGAGGDNLPLERYCTTIEKSIQEILEIPTAGPQPQARQA